MPHQLAIITPTYAPDLTLCEVLVESVNEFVSPDVPHYLLVDGHDVPAFRHLAGPRTLVLAKDELIPRAFRKIPRTNRWVSARAPRPASGWFMQQIVKIAVAGSVDATTLVFADSDLAFVRETTPESFLVDGLRRLYCKPKALTAEMTAHVDWYGHACEMIGVKPGPLPTDDFINWLVSWDTETVIAMRQRVEEVCGMPWHQALARRHHVSEYLLYGAYVDHFIDPAHFGRSSSSMCHPYWEYAPLLAEQADAFVSSFPATDLAVGIQSASHTSPAVRADVVSRLSGGRLHVPGLTV